MTTAIVPRVSGGEEEYGHLEEFRTDPIGLMHRIREECGDVGWFQLVDKQVVMLSGSEANEFFFRSSDAELNQAEAYPFMTPIFGEGVVFDADPERRAEMLHNTALRGEQMKGHAATIENEVKKIIADWGDEGEIELLDFFSELTIYTSTACLIGLKFREQLDGRFAHYYHQLERGTDPLCYVDPYLDIESFRIRDESRVKLVELVQEIMDGRIANPPKGKEDRDLLDVLVSIKDDDGNHRFTANEVTGMFISLMFAGHHTSSGTSSWTLIELIRHPEVYAEVLAELEELYADGQEVSFHALRQIPKLDNVVKETLAAASAADHPDAGRPGRVRGSGLPDPQGRLRRGVAGDLEPNSGGLPRPRRVQPRPLREAAAGGPGQPLDVDPVRRRQAPLRGSGVRADADQGDLLGVVARVRVRDGPARRELPQRPLEDGRAAGSAGKGALPQASKGLSTWAATASNSTRISARATPCANWRPRTCSRCPSAASSRSSTQSHPTTSARTSNGRSKCVPPKLFPSQRKRTDNGVTRSTRRLGRPLAARPTRTRRRQATGRTSADFYTEDATYGWNIGPKEDVMCVGKDEIRDVALGLEMQGLDNWVYEYQKVLVDEKQNEIVGFWKQIVNKTDGTQDEIYGIGGSWFRLNDDLLIEWQRDFFDFGHVAYMFGKLIGSGDLSEGMQKRIERSVAGEKLPGYYPLGQAPVPIW